MAVPKKIKILFLIGTLNGGGAERILVKVVNEICKKSNLDITVETVFDEGIYQEKIDKRIHQKTIFSKISKTSFGKLKKRLILYLLCLMPGGWLYHLFIRNKYDIEVAFIEGIASKIISGADASQRKYAWVHTNPILHPYSTKAYVTLPHERRCYQKFDGIFCVSGDVRVAFEEKYGIKAAVLYNPIDRDEIIKKSKSPTEDIKYTKGIRMVTVGRLVEQKGYARLIKALVSLKAEGYDFSLQIFGDGILKNDLMALVRANHMEGNIFFEGFTDNPYKYIKNADLFVCSSITEGFSTAVAEAVILGIPVLTTDCTGMREIFGDSGCGMIVDNSEIGLINGLRRIMNSPEILTDMKKGSLRRSKDFSLRKSIHQILSAIQVE
jgi:glycosyltransferase involved in cell wall biosynthesis